MADEKKNKNETKVIQKKYYSSSELSDSEYSPSPPRRRSKVTIPKPADAEMFDPHNATRRRARRGRRSASKAPRRGRARRRRSTGRSRSRRRM